MLRPVLINDGISYTEHRADALGSCEDGSHGFREAHPHDPQFDRQPSGDAASCPRRTAAARCRRQTPNQLSLREPSREGSGWLPPRPECARFEPSSQVAPPLLPLSGSRNRRLANQSQCASCAACSCALLHQNEAQCAIVNAVSVTVCRWHTSAQQSLDGAPPPALLQLRRQQQRRHEVRHRQVHVSEGLSERTGTGFTYHVLAHTHRAPAL